MPGSHECGSGQLRQFAATNFAFYLFRTPDLNIGAIGAIEPEKGTGMPGSETNHRRSGQELRHAAQAERTRAAGAAETGIPADTMIDMRLFRIPRGKVVPEKLYAVRLGGRPEWQLACRRDDLWLADGKIIGRVEDTTEIRVPEEDVRNAIDQIATSLLGCLETGSSPAVLQYYYDRDVLDMSHALLGYICAPEDRLPRKLAKVYRLMRIAGAAKAMPSKPLCEIAIGYHVLNAAGEVVYECGELIPALMRAFEVEGTGYPGLGVIFADGSVRYDHELARCPFMQAPRLARRTKPSVPGSDRQQNRHKRAPRGAKLAGGA